MNEIGKQKLLIHRPAGLGVVQLTTEMWFASLYQELRELGRFESWTNHPWHSPWMAMGKNVACQKVLDGDYDYLLQVDPDMVPDLYYGKMEGQLRFFSSSLAVLDKSPCGVVGAPYCGPAPAYRADVFGWAEHVDGAEVERFSHEQCHAKTREPKVEQVGGLGAGVLLMDRLAIEKIPHPRWEDEYKDETHRDLQLSFDTKFGQKAYENEVAVWCNWYSWAGHIHREVIGCPGVALKDEDYERVVGARDDVPDPRDMAIGPGTLKEVGILWKDSVDFEGWEGIGSLLERTAKAWRWWVGDWLAYGARQPWGERYDDAESKLGLSYDALTQCKYVASRVPILVRTPKLSFDHHRAVAKLTHAEQREWLSKAAPDEIGQPSKMSAVELRRAIRAAEKSGRTGQPPDEIELIERVQGGVAGLGSVLSEADREFGQRYDGVAVVLAEWFDLAGAWKDVRDTIEADRREGSPT